MRRTPLALALAASGLLSAAPAAAQTDLADRDLRCLMVMGMFGARAQSAEDKQAAAAGFSYFVGRLQGRDPAYDIKAKLRVATRRLTGVSELQPDFNRCGDELKAVDIQGVGEVLKTANDRRGVGR